MILNKAARESETVGFQKLRSRHTMTVMLIALSAFLFFSAQATELRLNEALQKATMNSPKIQRAQSQYRESLWKTKESYSGFLPTLSAQASYLFDKRYVFMDVNLGGAPLSIPQITPTTNLYLTAQWSLFDGFSSMNRYRSTESFEVSAKADQDWVTFQLEREVTLLFFKVVAAKELNDVAVQNLRALQDHLKNVRLLKKVGASTHYDVLRVEVQLSEAQTEFLNATDNVELSRARLSEALGEDENISGVSGGLPQLKTEWVRDLKSYEKAERKDLVALQKKSEGFQYQEDAAERYWVPRVSLFGQYQYYNNRNDRFDDYDNFRDAYNYGIMLTWNIFDGMTSIAKSKQSIEQRYQADRTLRQSELKAKRDLEFWQKKYLYYCAVYDSRLNDIIKSEESVRLAEEGLKAGARTNTDVLDAEAELYRAKAGAVNAKMGAIEAILNLELSTGKKLAQWE